MYKIRPEDLYTPEEYERARDKEYRDVISLERGRRLVTKTFSFLFEHPKIVVNQINEMIYLEKIHDQEEVRDLISIYSEILPGKNELSVTMFIEFPDEKTMISSMPKLAGIEKMVYLTFDDHSIRAIPEEGRSTETLESTLQYLKFKFSEAEKQAFLKSRNAFIETRHPLYSESARISEELLKDLRSEINESPE
jgi:DNA polymerase II large subunit